MALSVAELSGRCKKSGLPTMAYWKMKLALQDVSTPFFRPDFGRNLNTDLLDSLQCPVCFDLCQPDIYMCTNGHIVCNRCQPTLTECPTCRAEGRPILRCLPLEEMSRNVNRSCLNKKEGCKVMLNQAEMDEHFLVCDKLYNYGCRVFNPFRVQQGFCKWRGNRRGLVAHMQRDHPKQYSEDQVVHMKQGIGFNKKTDNTMLVAAHGELFWVEFNHGVVKGFASFYSIYIGSDEDASKYSCEFKYSSPDGLLQNTTCSQTLTLYSPDSCYTRSLKLPDSFIKQFLSDGCFSYSVKLRENASI